jgi:hypothetical protein
MINPIQLIKDVSGAYVAYDSNRTICATWNREHAQRALDQHIKSLGNETNEQIIGSWDK